MGKKKHRKQKMRAAMAEPWGDGDAKAPAAARKGDRRRHGDHGAYPGLGYWLARMGAAPSQQFLLGALVGGAATYALADKELRGKVIKSALKLYEGLVGGVEEVKEQIADLKAEIEASGQSPQA